jgi:hypothetical protein
MTEKFTVRTLPSLIAAWAVQKRRGMLPASQGRNAISRTFVNPLISRVEFQNLRSYSANRADSLSSSASQGGTWLS